MNQLSNNELLQILWNYCVSFAQPKPADVIIAFGGMDTTVAEHAAKLYQKKYAPKVVCTGGLGRRTKHAWEKSEAEVYAQILASHGVPQSDILLDSESTNTGENVINSLKLLNDVGIRCESALLVHQPVMLPRVYGTWKHYDQSKDIHLDCSTKEYTTYLQSQGTLADEVPHILVGDIQRLSVYADRGFQIPMRVPKHVTQAYKDLLQRGYDRYSVL